eukprot:1449799-Rhodomonas_salina.1
MFSKFFISLRWYAIIRSFIAVISGSCARGLVSRGCWWATRLKERGVGHTGAGERRGGGEGKEERRRGGEDEGRGAQSTLVLVMWVWWRHVGWFACIFGMGSGSSGLGSRV